MKNCDRGLENTFSSPRSQFFAVRTDPANNLFIFFPAINWLKIGFTQLCLYWFTCRLQTIVKNLTNERASKPRNYTKKDVLKNRFISNYFMLVKSNLPVKFSKSVFPIVKFYTKFD